MLYLRAHVLDIYIYIYWYLMVQQYRFCLHYCHVSNSISSATAYRCDHWSLDVLVTLSGNQIMYFMVTSNLMKWKSYVYSPKRRIVMFSTEFYSSIPILLFNIFTQKHTLKQQFSIMPYFCNWIKPIYAYVLYMQYVYPHVHIQRTKVLLNMNMSSY